MDELITKHAAIMDKYDPAKRVALVVDEWGIWTDVEPGTNLGFLFQQNSMRDAIIAATTLNIFNNHCDRVRMANLAQTINVLQALILTDKEKMLLTPTYHIFDLYKVHFDAKLLSILLDTPNYTSGNESVPAINASASQDKQGAVHLTLVNTDPSKTITIQVSLNNLPSASIQGKILTSAAFTDVNTFDHPEKIKIAPYNKAKLNKEHLTAELPPLSVVALEVK